MGQLDELKLSQFMSALSAAYVSLEMQGGNQCEPLMPTEDFLQDPQQRVRLVLGLAQPLESAGHGAQVLALLQALLAHPLQGASADFLALGDCLLNHACWSDCAKLSQALETQEPAVSQWLAARLAMERAEPEEAARRLAVLQQSGEIARDSAWSARLLEGQLRLAIVRQADASHLVLDPDVSVALKVRYYLQRREFAAAAGALAAAPDKQTPACQPDPELDWLAATLAAQAGQAGDAEQGWDKALRARPHHAACLFDRGRFRLAWKNPEGEKDLLRVLQIKPWAGQIALRLAGIYAERHDYRAALKLMDMTLMARDDQPEVVAGLLDMLGVLREKEKAFSVGARALERYPGNGEIWLSWGGCLYSLGKRDAAIAAYRSAMMSPGTRAAARSNLAKLLLEEGDTDLAISLWDEALAEAPGNRAIALNRAQALLKRGDLAEARQAIAGVLAHEAGNATALRCVAECDLAEGLLDEALAHASQALALSPREPLSYLIMAAVRNRRGEDKLSIAALEAGLAHVVKKQPLHHAIWRLLMNRNNYEGALQHAARAAQADPGEIEYRFMVADALFAQNRFDLARTVLEEAKLLDRERAAGSLIRFFEARNDWDAALAEARALLVQEPEKVRHYGLLGEILYRQEKYDEAEAVLREGIQKDPLRLSINRQLVGQLLAQEKFEAAIAVARNYLQRETRAPQYVLLLTALERGLQREEALATAETFLARERDNVIAVLAVSQAAYKLHRVEHAVSVLRDAAVRQPANLKLNAALVQLLLHEEQYEEAQELARKIAQHFSHSPEAVLLATVVLVESKEETEALEVLQSEVERYPKNQQLWIALYRLYRRMELQVEAERMLKQMAARFPDANQVFGWVVGEWLRYGKMDDAEKAADHWVRLKPNEWEPLFARLRVAEKRRQYSAVISLCETLQKRWPNEPAILSRLANAFSECHRMSQAVAYAKKAVDLRPDSVEYIDQLAAICAKSGIFDQAMPLIRQVCKLHGDRRYSHYQQWFFNLNCHPTLSAKDIWMFYHDWCAKAVTPYLPPEKEHDNLPDPERRLRIGYVSPDFRQHAVSFFSEPLLIEHDRDQFELFAFSHLEPGEADVCTARFKTYFDHWLDISSWSNDELYRRIRELNIDILIDLAGHTSNNKLMVFAQKPAPIQGSWIFGAGQTTGLTQIDALFCDNYIVPPDFEEFCSEAVVRVNVTGMPYLPPDNVPDIAPLPAISRGFVTFASFARPIRLSIETLKVWARILNALPDALLQLDHLPYAEPELQAMIGARFADAGGNPAQLKFVNIRPHWEAFSTVDIVLDTFPTSSGTTVTEALWMGVPAITMKSRPVMGRIGAAQLAAVGLEASCVAGSEEEYVRKALALANDVPGLALLRNGLREQFRKSPLMDYKKYAGEAACVYRKLWRTWCENNSGTQSKPK